MGENTNSSCIRTTHGEAGYVIVERNIFVTNAERFWRGVLMKKKLLGRGSGGLGISHSTRGEETSPTLRKISRIINPCNVSKIASATIQRTYIGYSHKLKVGDFAEPNKLVPGRAI